MRAEAGIGAAPAPPPRGPMVPRAMTVAARRRETPETWTLTLRPRAGEGSGDDLPFAPGQFTMLAAGGCGEVPISISGRAADGGLEQTVRAVGLATQAICAAEPGTALAVRGPYGRPWPLAACLGVDVVVAAGGIGLAPLRPAVRWLLERLVPRGRLLVLYGGRSPELLLYRHELEAWALRGAEVVLTVDSAGPGWDGQVGVVPRLVERAPLDPRRTIALLCGPEVMMRFTAAALVDRGIPPERVHVALERTMQCGIGHCGHCQLGPTLVCRDGPVYRWSELAPWLAVREL